MFGLGSSELVIIALVIFVLFGGGKKIPELFSGLGKGIRSFRRSLDGQDEEQPEEKTASKIDNTNQKPQA